MWKTVIFWSLLIIYNLNKFVFGYILYKEFAVDLLIFIKLKKLICCINFVVVFK